MIRGGRTCLEELAACFVISQPGIPMCDAHSKFRLAVHNLHQLSTICADKSWSHFSIHERAELFLNMIQTGRNRSCIMEIGLDCQLFWCRSRLFWCTLHIEIILMQRLSSLQPLSVPDWFIRPAGVHQPFCNNQCFVIGQNFWRSNNSGVLMKQNTRHVCIHKSLM